MWHKHLGHISKERVERLIDYGILPHLDSDDLEIFVDCVKGKLTKTKKHGATCSQICWRLFIQTLVDLTLLPCVATSTSLHSLMISPDMAMYFFIKEKLDALEMFKVFRTEVEKQLGKVVKIVRFDISGEYYGKHGDAGQQKGPFARYLHDNGIFT